MSEYTSPGCIGELGRLCPYHSSGENRWASCGPVTTTNESAEDAMPSSTTHTDKSTTWLEAQALVAGSDNQRARWNAGVLPDDELTELARTELFAPLVRFKRWEKIPASHVPHQTHLGLGCGGDQVKFQTGDPTAIEGAEWDRLQMITSTAATINRHAWMKHAKTTVEVTPVLHTATCEICIAQKQAISVVVRIPWAGRLLTRQYAL